MEIVGNSRSIKFGSAGASTSIAGVIISASVGDESKEFVFEDEVGDNCLAVLHGQTKPLELEVAIADTVAVPTQGDTVEVGSVEGHVISAKKKWAKAGVMVMTVTAKDFVLTTV